MGRFIARAVYASFWLLVLGGLSAELALQVNRRLSERGAQRFRDRNVFEQAQELSTANALWDERGIRYRPGGRLRIDVAGQTHEIVIDSHGFRTVEFEVPKPEGVVRVACIGGSTTVQGRTNDETYPAILGRLLREAHPREPLEVLNLGINGTGSEYWLRRRRELLSFDPDLVIQYNFVNDLFWECLPKLADEHPWRGRAGASLLLSQLFDLDPSDLDPCFLRTIRRHRALARELRLHGVSYVAGTFAGPDPATCSPAFSSYLDLNTESWSQSFRLRRYRTYYRLLRRYDELFVADAQGRRFDLAQVHRLVKDAALFVDLCHMNDEGIAQLAAAFAPVASDALEARDRPGSAEAAQPSKLASE